MRVALAMPARKKAKSRRAPASPFRRDRKGRALQEIGATIVAGGRGPSVGEEIAELVQRTCKYRWAGGYKITRKEFVIGGATNKMRPGCPRFSGPQGLRAQGTGERRPVMVRGGDQEPCFLPNFWSTKSEVVVAIIDDEHDRVLGVINVESAKVNAFDKSDRDFLEGVARIIWRALR